MFPLLHNHLHIHSQNCRQSTTTINPFIHRVHVKMQAYVHEGTPAGVDAPPYTTAEKKWLSTHWGGEFKFLQAYQLSIHDEDDREEGRRIVRAFIHQDKMNAQGGGA